ncbi:MAG: transporter substrate-binding domain-containing protein, partial [Verrucomicrobiota bacterium]|nr:transporter substrate-binding domain-containing protein [Verrucomicrobiota bacterium]
MRSPSSIFRARLRRLLLGIAAGMAVSIPGLGAETASAPANDETRFAQPLIVPTPIDSYPTSFLGPSGQCEGFSVELLDAVARAMDLKLKRVISPGKLLESDFDILQTFTHTQEREGTYDFSVPYFELQGTLFVRKDKNFIHSISDLNGRELAIIGKGGPGDTFVARYHLDGVHRIYYSTVQAALFSLNAGRHDAVFASRLTTLSVIDHFKLGNIRPLGLPVDGYNMPQCFAVHKGDFMLLARLNEGLAILHRTGEYDKIYDKWFGRFEPTRFTREQ